jgi:hypothetical protein
LEETDMRFAVLSSVLTFFMIAAFAHADPPGPKPQPRPRVIRPGTSLKMPQAPPDRRAAKRRARSLALLRALGKPVSRIELDEEPFEEVMAWFREQGLANVVIRWQVLDSAGTVSRDTPITLALENMTLGELLDMVLEQASFGAGLASDELTYHIVSGILQISTRADFDRMNYTRTYYVEDLLQPIMVNTLLPFLQIGEQFAYVAELDPVVASGAAAQRPIIDVIDSGSLFGPGEPERGHPDFESMREEELEKLINLLKQVRPETWRENGGKGTVQPFGERLVITQNIEMHEIIGGLFSPQSRY